MTVERLIRTFSTHQNIVQVNDVRDQIVEWGFYDSITISPFDQNPEFLLGTMVNFICKHPYGVEKEHFVIRYNRNISIQMQRLVCVKELVHSMDPPDLRVASKSQLDQLLKDMLHEDGEPAAAPAAFETIAIYQALAILCPEEVREDLYKDYPGQEDK